MKKHILALTISHILIASAYADSHTLHHLNTIEITAQAPFSQKMGTQTLTAEQISNLPTLNGSLTELLKHNPNVQFANTANSSLAGGELEPETVSFHGEKFYNNNFMIDGLSNNNNIDPITTSGTAGRLGDLVSGHNAWDLPAGGEQSLWIDNSLIESLEVFDSNISAKYGNFTGGVLDAKIKKPNTQQSSGRVSFRTTRDAWASFHIDQKIRDDFEQSSYLYYQPKFTKNFYTASINQPLSDHAAVILSYNRSESEIPTYQSWANNWRNQQRLNETYLLKAMYHTDGGDQISATAIYAPHTTSLFRRGIKDSGFDNQGGGYRFNVDWNHLANWGKVKTTLGYQQDENTISNESDHYYPWFHRFGTQTSSVITWATGASTARQQTGLQGGYGKFATEKKTISLKQDFDFKTFDWLAAKHHINAGWEYNREDADYQRFNDTTLGGSVKWDSSVQCQAKDDGCITGEQYTSIRLLYPARQVSAQMNRYSLYAEDTMNWGRLELTPGVRISYDDFMKNTNISPRFAFTADIFANEKTKLFGGWNRYHANNIFAYKLKNGISSFDQQTRSINNGILSDWTTGALKERPSSKYNHNISGLKTPFSDEINFGIAQNIADHTLTLKWVNRNSKKSFARSQTLNDAGERILDNSGWSKADTVSLNIKPNAPMSFDGLDLNWNVNAQWSKHKQNTANTYDDTTENDLKKAIFENKLIDQVDLPAMDFHTPWSINANVDMHFPNLNFTWGHSLGYRTGYTAYKSTLKECPTYDANICGDYTGRATLFEKTKFSDYLTYDMRLSYKQPTFKKQSLELTLDINNVFDKKIASSTGTSLASAMTYQMGRQFWLGAAYNW